MIDWKARYAELVEHSEKRQKYFSRRESMLVTGFLSTLQLARGFSEALDTRLLATQRLLRDQDTKTVDLGQAVSALEKSAETALTDRKNYLKEASQQARKIASQVRSLGPDTETSHTLKQLEKSLNKSDLSFSEFLNALTELQRLHKVAVKQAKSKKRIGFLSRLGAAAPVGELEEDVQDSESERDQLGESLEYGSQSVETPSLLSTLTASFASLLQQLGRPEQTVQLENKLARGLNADELTVTMDEICEKSIEALQDERASYRSSASRLVTRLDEATNQIDRCIGLNESNQQAADVFRQKVTEGLSDLVAVAEKADDVETLKQAIRLSVSTVAKALDEHSNASDRLTLTSALDGLSSQLSHMQDMGRASLFRVEERIQSATKDSVTELPTRVVLRQQSQMLMSEELLCVAMCRFNDKEADETAHRVLAEAFRNIEATTHAFRVGPNQFTVVLPGKNVQGAGVIMDNVRQAVAFKTHYTVCVGVAASTDSDTIESVLARADRLSRTGKDQTNLAPPR